MKDVIIVSNRLPIKISKDNDNNIKYLKTVGGLSRAIDSIKIEFTWVGWIGIPKELLSQDEIIDIKIKLKKEFNFCAIFLSQKEITHYYDNYCNEVLWANLHGINSNNKKYHKDYGFYKKINEKFSKEIAKIAKKSSIIWINDYHLMLLPSFLRLNGFKNIGFFLHTPMIKKILKLKNINNILSSLNKSALIGFQSKDDKNNFKFMIKKINQTPTKTITHPIPVDFIFFNNLSKKTKPNFISNKDKKIILTTIDRTDPSKNVPNKIKSYRYMLKSNLNLINKIIFVIISIDSRQNSKIYEIEKEKIRSEILKIKNECQDSIIYINHQLSDYSLCSLYKQTDIMFLPSLADGMNLVAKEFIASNIMSNKKKMILSDKMGVAKELKFKKTISSPNSIDNLKYVLEKCILDKNGFFKNDFCKSKDAIRKNNVNEWAKKFIKCITSRSKKHDENIF